MTNFTFDGSIDLQNPESDDGNIIFQTTDFDLVWNSFAASPVSDDYENLFHPSPLIQQYTDFCERLAIIQHDGISSSNEYQIDDRAPEIESVGGEHGNDQIMFDSTIFNSEYNVVFIVL